MEWKEFESFLPKIVGDILGHEKERLRIAYRRRAETNVSLGIAQSEIASFALAKTYHEHLQAITTDMCSAVLGAIQRTGFIPGESDEQKLLAWFRTELVPVFQECEQGVEVQLKERVRTVTPTISETYENLFAKVETEIRILGLKMRNESLKSQPVLIPTPQSNHPELRVSKSLFRETIQKQITKGSEMLTRRLEISKVDLFLQEVADWSDFNLELLKRSFSTDVFEREYSESHIINVSAAIRAKYVTDLHRPILQKAIGTALGYLGSILNRLELIPEMKIPPAARLSASPAGSGNRVFVVHGHDVAVKFQTARFLEQLGLVPVILHEQPGGSKTVIEKFEHFSDVDFAVILLTPDDVGSSKDHPGELRPRARQNVILELGYFFHKLGRSHVCALYSEGVETPSDFDGVCYVSLDPGGAWRYQLARELRGAGLPVDLNKIT